MMITPQPQSQPINPLARFVTPEAVADTFNPNNYRHHRHLSNPEYNNIQRIECRRIQQRLKASFKALIF